MPHTRSIPMWLECTLLGGVLLLFAAMSAVGITWGLPSRSIDKYLFGGEPPWPGEKIYRLAGASTKFDPASLARRGADVDVDPLRASSNEPVLLTGTDEDVATIYLRYRLYTYQPDEMITMMALAGMNPRKLQFDPRLYQYGGLFIYPVGALIGACGALGLIDVRSDVVYYLDHPDEFGKFYVVARAYSAAWGLIGVVIVFAIARRLGQVLGRSSARLRRDSPGVRVIEEPFPHGRGSDRRGASAGLPAALLFTLMPVVVTMAHEGKPHLSGAVLMLAAVLFAMRHLSERAAGFRPHGCPNGEDTANARSLPGPKSGTQGMGEGEPRGSRDFWLICICCGAAFGMVLSSWPIFVLIPLVVWLERRSHAAGSSLRDVATGEDAPEDATPRGLKPAAQQDVKRTLSGIAVGVAVYLITNPYILINAFINRDVLASNFGNSLAMYEVSRVGEGFLRVLDLSVEGATLPVVVLGAIALIVASLRRGGTVKRGLAVDSSQTDHAHAPRAEGFRRREGSSGEDPPADARRRGLKPAAQEVEHARASLGHDTPVLGHATQALPLRVAMLPLVVPAAVFFLQFVLIGAGKPAEYGRFGIFPDTALAIGTACLLTRRWTKLRAIVNWVPGAFVVLWVGLFGGLYLGNFYRDASGEGSRTVLGRAWPIRSADPFGHRVPPDLAVLAEPAPYNCPPIPFLTAQVIRYSDREQARLDLSATDPSALLLIEPVDLSSQAHPLGPKPWERSLTHIILQPSRWARLCDVMLAPTPISWANKPFRLQWADSAVTLVDGHGVLDD